jgi:hypothetical protein
MKDYVLSCRKKFKNTQASTSYFIERQWCRVAEDYYEEKSKEEKS